MDPRTVCRHGTCECETSRVSGYCSVYCENVDRGEALPGYGDFEGKCACGHAGCQHTVHEPASSPRTKISVGPDHP